MDSHGNPWSFQQQQQQQQTQFLEDEDDDTTAANSPFHSQRSHDRKHYSFASSITLASDSFHDDFFSLRKSTPSTTTGAYDPSDRNLQQQQQQQQSSHVRTWSQEDTITSASDYGEDDKHHNHRHHHHHNTGNFQRHSDNDDVLEALSLADNTLESSLLPSSTGHALSLTASSNFEVIPHTHTDLAERNMSDSGIGVEGDVLGHLVQKLQSEVADTRAVVSDLETRLNAAEHSNKHIVEELKMLLADAEGTLVGSDDSDSGGESEVVSSKQGSGSEDETNIVYNRICHALQSLISEAQTALVRNTSAALFAPPPTERGPCRHQQQQRLKPITQNQGPQGQSIPGLFIDDGELLNNDGSSNQGDTCSHSSCRTSRRSSANLSRSPFHLRVASASSAASVTSSSSRLSRSSSRNSVYSRMIWKEKQLEQYERYRRSCDRVSLELEMLLNDTRMDADYDDDYSNPLGSLFPLLTESPFAHLHPGISETSKGTTPMKLPPLSTATLEEEAKAQPGRGGRAEALRAGSRAERIQRNFQAQFLSPQVHTGRSHSHLYGYQGYQHQQHPPSPYLRFRSSGKSTSMHSMPRQQQLRNFRNQGVGSSRSQSLLLQLYGLWKQTWLRRRIMHILTGSLEVGLILWVIFKLGEVSLSLMGVPLLKGGPQTWLLYVYGDRQGPGSTVAKELYEKIRRDGLKLRQVHLRRARESEQILQDFAASEVASGLVAGFGPGGNQWTKAPFSAAGMVWGPVQRMITHAATGFVLAYLADHGKRLSKKL
ncbi:hypothetical protein EC957_010513 [Mortierella hygrophila]|uniref:Uncharacterized protein n=1 Tax=Mortierella hygrophila TaxID=979708 RepID=A0A9P6F8Y5_9FUNG|nr:hypothetical protein EC957_010513 [Mortierella hygrophila]